MAAAKGEGHRARKALLVGGGLTIGASLAAAWFMRSGRRGVHDIEMIWDVPLDGIEDEAARVPTAVIPPLRGKQFKDFLAVVSTDAIAYDRQLAATQGLAAVAVKDRESGVWIAGVAPEGAGLGLTEVTAAKRQAAIYICSPAIAEIVLGVTAEGCFSGAATQATEIADRPTILDNYPGTPVFSRTSAILA